VYYRPSWIAKTFAERSEYGVIVAETAAQANAVDKYLAGRVTFTMIRPSDDTENIVKSVADRFFQTLHKQGQGITRLGEMRDAFVGKGRFPASRYDFILFDRSTETTIVVRHYIAQKGTKFYLIELSSPQHTWQQNLYELETIVANLEFL